MFITLNADHVGLLNAGLIVVWHCGIRYNVTVETSEDNADMSIVSFQDVNHQSELINALNGLCEYYGWEFDY